ncbi:hypothetical protein ABIF34_003353 [Bradyrhizobium japonicum]
MPRFLRRLAEGVFDEEDVRDRALELGDFIQQAREQYGISAPIAVGYEARALRHTGPCLTSIATPKMRTGRPDMSVEDYADDLSATVHYALETTRAVAVCPFHSEVTIRVGDDAAESHAFERAKRIVRSDGTNWETQDLRQEFARQLSKAADGECPRCAQH